MAIASLYPSINPSLLLDFANTKQLDPRITFTRTTTATYYDGVTTAKAEENLVTYSQAFDNAAWSKSQVTVTADATTAPDGTSTAESMVGDGTANFHLIAQNIPTLVSANTYALSIYAKANGLNYIQIHTNSSPDGRANFDITSGAGALGTVSGNFSGAAITSVGNGWFRCTVLLTSSTAIYFQIGLISSATGARAESFTTSSGAYLWGAQLEQRSSATAYTATTTQAITNYIPVLQTAGAGQARFDHNPTTGESLGLLIEEARTNSFIYSEQFDNAAWTTNGSAITANVAIAPDGTKTMDKLNETATTTWHGFYPTTRPFTASGTYTLSVYAKAGERSFLAYRVAGLEAFAYYDLSNGTVASSGTGTASITNCGNGVYRCIFTFTTTGLVDLVIQVSNSNYNVSTISYAGVANNGIYVWGAQVEAGSFATSYIATTSASVTRNADAASMTGTNFSSWFNNGEGTLYGEMQRAQGAISGTNFHIATISSGSFDNYYKIRLDGSSTSRDGFLVASSATQCAFTQGTTSAGNFYKLSLGVKANDFGFSSDNTTASTDTSGIMSLGLNVLNIGTDINGSQSANNRIRKIAYYPVKATSAQLQALTS